MVVTEVQPPLVHVFCLTFWGQCKGVACFLSALCLKDTEMAGKKGFRLKKKMC